MLGRSLRQLTICISSPIALQVFSETVDFLGGRWSCTCSFNWFRTVLLNGYFLYWNSHIRTKRFLRFTIFPQLSQEWMNLSPLNCIVFSYWTRREEISTHVHFESYWKRRRKIALVWLNCQLKLHECSVSYWSTYRTTNRVLPVFDLGDINFSQVTQVILILIKLLLSGNFSPKILL